MGSVEKETVWKGHWKYFANVKHCSERVSLQSTAASPEGAEGRGQAHAQPREVSPALWGCSCAGGALQGPGPALAHRGFSKPAARKEKSKRAKKY